MSRALTRWQRLLEEIKDGRESQDHEVTELQNSIARRFRVLGRERHCSPNAIGWIQARRSDAKRGGGTRIELKTSADGRDSWGHPAVRLRGLTHLEDGAVLTLSIHVDGRKTSLLSYSVSIQGAARAPHTAALSEAHDSPSRPPPTKQLWHARIDLTEQPEGEGICSHPLLHCHIGSDPSTTQPFSPRVPLPWLHPGDALDWLLATIEPALEPTLDP